MSNDPIKNAIIGEIQLKDGKRSMCIVSDRGFGGGKGSFWATLDHAYDFSLNDEYMFYRGICRIVRPTEKKIGFEITEGPTWGKRALGKIILVHCEEISHIRIAAIHGPKLIEDSQFQRSRELAETVFAETSLKELRKALRSDREELLAAIIGKAEFEFSKNLIQAFIELCEAVHKTSVSDHRMPNPDEWAAKRKIQSLLKRAASGKLLPISEQLIQP